MYVLQVDGVTAEIKRKDGVVGNNVLRKSRVASQLKKCAKSRGSRLLSTLQIDGVTDKIARKVGVTGDNILRNTRVASQLKNVQKVGVPDF